MTKKDYILLAATIHSAYKALMYATVNAGETKRSIEVVIDQLGVALYNDNNRFDIDRFTEACNINDFDNLHTTYKGHIVSR